jgi:hypothetical protein
MAIGTVNAAGDSGDGFLYDGSNFFFRGELTAGELGDTQTVIRGSHLNAGYMPLIDHYYFHDGRGDLNDGRNVSDGSSRDFIVPVRNGSKISVKVLFRGSHESWICTAPRIRIKKNASQNNKPHMYFNTRGVPGSAYYSCLPVAAFADSGSGGGSGSSDNSVYIYTGYVGGNTSNDMANVWAFASSGDTGGLYFVPYPVGTLKSSLSSRLQEFTTDLWNPQYEGNATDRHMFYANDYQPNNGSYGRIHIPNISFGTTFTDNANVSQDLHGALWSDFGGDGFGNVGSAYGYGFKDIYNSSQGYNGDTTSSQIAAIPADTYSFFAADSDSTQGEGFGFSEASEAYDTKDFQYLCEIPEDYFDGTETNNTVDLAFGVGLPWGGNYSGGTTTHSTIVQASLQVTVHNNG